LHARGILWAPDFVVNAGGVIYASAVEMHSSSRQQAIERVGAITGTLGTVFAAAAEHSITPLEAARRVAHERLAAVASAAPSQPRSAELRAASDAGDV
jgi:leucine dehydrogenase